MTDTPLSLLERLCQQPNPPAWQCLVELYTPLIHKWLRHAARLQPADLEDVAQEVLAVVVRELLQFRHDGRRGAFRCWLRTITVNRLHKFVAKRQHTPEATGDSDFANRLQQLEDPTNELCQLWDQEHDHLVVQRLLELIEPEFTATTWRAFRRVVLEGRDAASVAAELGLTANAVCIAKSRILARLREESRGLLD